MMGKKKVLFCIRDFNHGGIPKSLSSLLSIIDKDKYDITLFCAFQQGYYKSVFSQYNVLPQDKLLYWFCVNYKSLSGIKKFVALLFKVLYKLLLKIKIDLFDWRLKCLAKRYAVSGNYDVAIAYAEGWITRFVSFMSGINRKIAWIHMDYKRVLAYEKGNMDADIYATFDFVVSPSIFSANSFADVFPNLAHKMLPIKNILDVDTIKNQALDAIKDSNFDNNTFAITSVGRICYEKQFYEIPSIAAELKKMSVDFKWYIIGSGPDNEVAILKDNILKYNVEDCVILLGAKDNPYPYIANSNLVALLSVSETFSYVAYEAKILGVPIISTDFGAASEIVDSNCGVVAPKSDFHKEIYNIMTNKELYVGMVDSLKNFQYNNSELLSKIDLILN